MISKIAIVLKGRADSGKTYTILKVYELLKAKYKDATIEVRLQTPDIRVILKINRKKIGIESQGDPTGRLEESLNLFVEKNCHVIVCDTRTRGKTVRWVEKLEQSGYSIQWFEQKYWVQTKKQEENNLEIAKTIIKEVETVIMDK